MTPSGGPKYIGQVFPIPVAQGGLVGVRDQGAIDPDKLIVARNISLFGLTVQKEGGAIHYNASAISGAPTIIGGWDWWPSASVQRAVIAASDGKLYKDSGTGTFPVTLKSGLTMTNSVPVFVEGGAEAAGSSRKLFCFTGLNQVQVLAGDGVVTTDLATPPADWAASYPTFGLVHDSRMWGGGNTNDPHRLYYTATANHEVFTGAGTGTLSIYPGEGERIVGAVSFKGLIVVFKYPQGIYLVDTSDPTVANWRVARLTRGVGGVSPLGAAVTDDDIIFIDPAANFHLLSKVQSNDNSGSVSASNLARQNHIYSFLQDNINLARVQFARAVYYAQKREMHIALAGSGSSVNSVRFIIDFNKEDTTRFLYSDRDVCESLWLRKDSNNTPRLVSGDNAGFMWLMDQSTKSKNNIGYSASFQTPYMDFSWVDERLASVRKIGQYLEMEVAPTGNWNLSVDVYWDGTYTQTVNFNMGVSGASIGSFTLGTDKLAGDQILTRKKRITGSGRRISLAAYNTGAGEDFAVGKFYLHCLVADERPGRGQ
jgi:hypothetical protein